MGRAERVDATVPAHAACLAGLPLLHSILLPTEMGWQQQEQVEANLAVMIIVASSVVVVVCRGRFCLPTTINLTRAPWVSSGLRRFNWNGPNMRKG